MAKEKKVKIDMLVTLPDGSLAFKTVEVSKGNIEELIENTKDPIARHNLEKELAKRKLLKEK